jgi:predicted PurR-regulated permease PerM
LDQRTQKRAADAGRDADDPDFRARAGAIRDRNRLIAAIALFSGAGFFLALPFALRAAADFFLPVTAALVIAICLVPLLEWLERQGVPSPVAAMIALGAFLFAANSALVLVVVPAWDWIAELPERIHQIRSTLKPVIDFYTQAQEFIDGLVRMATRSRHLRASADTLVEPGSLVQMLAESAPSVVINVIFGLLTIFFALSGWTKLRRRTIRGRGSFSGAMTIARVIQNVVDATSRYVLTISLINLVLGIVVALALMTIGMPSPLMWGGFVALLNFVPYFGPMIAALLLALGGLMSFSSLGLAMAPAAIMLGCHLVETNVVTPLVLGGRLKMNPLLILVSLSFWTWVWGTPGALLAVPLLIIIRTVVAAAGKPDIAGFLFESGTLTRPVPESAEDIEDRPVLDG